MLFISPPFGNYIGLPKTTRIYGSFTLKPRDGLLYHVITTLRYIPKYRGWVNKIGLRNKGIDWALKNVPENLTFVGIPARKVESNFSKESFEAYGISEGKIDDPNKKSILALFSEIHLLNEKVSKLESRILDNEFKREIKSDNKIRKAKVKISK